MNKSDTNRHILDKFYSAFQQKDYKTMQKCYADEAMFNDPVFRNLSSSEVRAMWEMLCVRGKDLELTYTIDKIDNHGGQVTWIAEYTFGPTKRKITNHITGTFELRNGKIFRHDDHFDFYKWCKQAFGITGTLVGWTPFFQTKVRKTALNNLSKFMG